MSVRPSTADVDQGDGLVSFVPNPEVLLYSNKKPDAYSLPDDGHRRGPLSMFSGTMWNY
jgi:hypothetical protein